MTSGVQCIRRLGGIKIRVHIALMHIYDIYIGGAIYASHEIAAEKDVGKTVGVMSSMLNKSFVSRCTNCALINIHGADSWNRGKSGC